MPSILFRTLIHRHRAPLMELMWLVGSVFSSLWICKARILHHYCTHPSHMHVPVTHAHSYCTHPSHIHTYITHAHSSCHIHTTNTHIHQTLTFLLQTPCTTESMPTQIPCTDTTHMNFTYLHPHYTRVTHVGTHSPIYMYHRSLHSHLPMGLPHPTHRHGCTNIPRYTHVPRHVEHTHTRTIDFHSTDTQGPDTQFTLSYIPQLMSHLYMHDTHMTISPHQHRHILKCAHSFS